MITMKNVVADVDTITCDHEHHHHDHDVGDTAVDADAARPPPTIIMQMKCLQAGQETLRNIIGKNWIRSYRNYPKMTAMV